MKNLNTIKKITLVTLVGTMLALGAGFSDAHAMGSNPDGYAVPSLEGYIKIGQKWKDSDKDPTTGVNGKETLYEVFKKEGTGYITKYSTEIVGQNMNMLGGRPVSAEQSYETPNQTTSPPADTVDLPEETDDLPF